MFQKKWHLYLTVKTGQDEKRSGRACPQTAVQVIRLVRFYCIVPEVYVCFAKCIALSAVAYPGILFWVWGGFNKFSWGQREQGSGDSSPLVRRSGGTCNLVQEISFHIVKFSSFWYFIWLFIMTTNLFVIANVKQLQTGGSFRILLPFFPNILGCWRPKFNNF